MTTCRDLRYASPDYILTECAISYLNITQSTLLLGQFLYLLNKLVCNNRRALAGYTKNTVAISVHIRILEGSIVWCVMWGFYSFLDVDEASAETKMVVLMLCCLVYSLSVFFETVTLFLLCSGSIGVNAFKKSYIAAFALSILLLLAFVILGVFWKETPVYMGISLLLAVRYLLTSMLYLAGLYYSKKTAPTRRAVTRYVCFIVPVSLLKAGARLMIAWDIDAGFCVNEVAKFVMFACFPSIVYIALKRDSQYWTEDVSKSWNDASDPDDFFNDTTKQELPKYSDVVIPKTELYYRSKLEESPSGSLQLHLWRRKIVCVKVFQMDILTRDNIFQFKSEAGAMRRLRHDNIVRFMGVVIDPPNMGIVMEYCSNGDLFTVLEKLRQKFDESEWERKREDSFASFTSKSPQTPSFKTSSSKLYSELSEDTEVKAGRQYSSCSQDDCSSIDIERSLLHSPTPEKKQFSPFKVMKQIAKGMRYLHSGEGGRQAHGDLKSLNILLTANWDCKIADFGECRNVGVGASGGTAGTRSTQKHDVVGTPAWTAPEVLNHDRVGLKSDVFSFGVVVWEIMTWLHPTIYLPAGEIDDRDRISKRKKRVNGLPRYASKSPESNSSYMGRSGSEDRGRMRLKAEAAEDDDDGGLNDLRKRLLTKMPCDEIWSSGGMKGSEVDASINNGLGWGKDDMRVGMSQQNAKLSSVVIKLNLEDADRARVLIAEKKYRPPLVHAPNARELVDLMQRCWSQDPNLRPSFNEIVSELETFGKSNENADIDSRFPFETGNLVNYAIDSNASPMTPRTQQQQKGKFTA